MKPKPGCRRVGASSLRQGRRARIVALVGIAAALAACSSSGGHAHQTSSAHTLAGGPRGVCGTPTPRLVALPRAGVGHMIGEHPAWAGVYASHDTHRGTLTWPADAPTTPFGRRIKVLWVVAPSQHSPVTVTWRSADGHAIVFTLTGNRHRKPPTATLTLDPQHPPIPGNGSGYAFFPSYIFVSRPDCYTLTVHTPNRAWQTRLHLGP